ncbi:MAG: magnesium/cobalt transporter CorA [Hyphomicrobiales bacterium]
MLTIYELSGRELKAQTGLHRITDDVVWLDLVNPTPDEEEQVEKSLNIDVPTREEQQEIEVSSRLYQENGAYFMTATLVYQPEKDEAKTTPVSFILAGKRLVTVRYAEPRAFALFAARCNRSETDLKSGPAVMIGLLDTIVDRLADFIERIQGQVETLSHSVFENQVALLRGSAVSMSCSNRSGEKEITSKAREAPPPLGRLLTFFAYAVNERKEGKPLQSRVRAASRDVSSLTDHATFLSGKIIFLLDATLGMIQIQQNDIIKIFSVAAVVFLPPTLIASIYGMNFHVMPELDWLFGYPFALALMVLFAVLPYIYFKHRGWL